MYLSWANDLDPKGAASYVKDLADRRKFQDFTIEGKTKVK